MPYPKSRGRSKYRAFYIDMLRPFLTEWRTTKEAVGWLIDNSGYKSIPTTRELGMCLSKHPSVESQGKHRKQWRWRV